MNTEPDTHAATAEARQTPGSAESPKEPGSRKANLQLFADIAFKATLALGGGYFGHEFQQSMQTSQLLTQREQSDTQIRAEMFKAITDKLFGPKGKSPQNSAEQAVFTELLALNFNEHIEIKPLMIDVDKRLAEGEVASNRPKKVRDEMSAQRTNLRVTAAVVRNRQVARIVSAETEASQPLEKKIAAWFTRLLPGAHAAQAESPIARNQHLRYVAIRYADAARSSTTEATSGGDCSVPDNQGQTLTERGTVREESPDKLTSLAIRALPSPDWDSRRFIIQVEPDIHPAARESTRKSGIAGDSRAATDRIATITRTGTAPNAAVSQVGVTFAVTDFDFPLTDNTLLSNRTRYSFTLEAVCPAEQMVKLGLLWFPSDYYPAHERPTNRKQLASYLDLKA
jgi:hypothetical protein